MGVGEVLLRRQRGEVGGVVGFPRAGLVPIDDDEMLLQRAQLAARGRQLAAARAAGEEKQNRVGGIAAANGNPFCASVQLNALQGGDAPGDRPAVGANNGRRGGKPLRKQHGGGGQQQQPGDAGDARQRRIRASKQIVEQAAVGQRQQQADAQRDGGDERQQRHGQERQQRRRDPQPAEQEGERPASPAERRRLGRRGGDLSVDVAIAYS